MATPFDYIEPKELKASLNEEGKSLIVVDVRDNSEFEGGHIVGAINSPSGTFAETHQMKKLFDDNKEKSTFVFHCFQSQIRGPNCARAFANYISETIPEESRPEIKVLRGGYREWDELYSGNPSLIEESPDNV